MTSRIKKKNKSDSTSWTPKEDSSTQTTRCFVGVMVESNERDSELSESGLSMNNDERAIQFQKIMENGQCESKVDASSERNALNFQNMNTKDTPQETKIKKQYATSSQC